MIFNEHVSQDKTNKNMQKFKSEIVGNLEIIVTENEDELDGEKLNWKEILIHGDSEALKSFANLLLEMAELNQNNIDELPIGSREHKHLRPKFELSKNSVNVIVGRLDAKGIGSFPESYIPKDS